MGSFGVHLGHLGSFGVIGGYSENNIPAGHPPQHASNGIGGGLSPHFAGSLQPRHSVKHASVVSEKKDHFLAMKAIKRNSCAITSLVQFTSKVLDWYSPRTVRVLASIVTSPTVGISSRIFFILSLMSSSVTLSLTANGTVISNST